MKLKPSTKKLLLCAVLFVAVVGLSGCRIPTDETGAIKQITLDTTFQETFATENWFNALFDKTTRGMKNSPAAARFNKSIIDFIYYWNIITFKY